VKPVCPDAQARTAPVPLQSLKLVYALVHPPRARTRSERRGQAELKENDALSSLINGPRARARARADLSVFSGELVSRALNAGDVSHKAYSPFSGSDPDISVRLDVLAESAAESSLRLKNHARYLRYLYNARFIFYGARRPELTVDVQRCSS